MRWTLAQINQAVAGRIVHAESLPADMPELVGVATDTRKPCAGQLFIALSGKRFDAHDYLEVAVRQGAAALLVSRAENLPPGVPVIRVDDTRLALGRLAAAWRREFTLPVLAVTGSNGKTTTREMIAAILKTSFGDDAVLTPQGNFNNDIGLPLTLLQLGTRHRAVVLEMGMNHPGEIRYLADLARPTAALVTNAQRAHLENMGNLEGVAMEKGNIYSALEADGVAIINNDDPYAENWRRQNVGRPSLTFALDNPADIMGKAVLRGLDTRLVMSMPDGERVITLQTPGRHNVRNALAAAAAGLAVGLGLDALAAGLAAFKGVKGRLQRQAGPYGAVILDDTYNANPDSVRAGIDVLTSTVGRQILVLGDMGEIGEASGQYHDEIGGYAKSMGVDRLYALGEASQQAVRNFAGDARSFKTPEALVKSLLAELKSMRKSDRPVTVLVKGSRFMHMESVVELLKQEAIHQDAEKENN
ncbi:MAG: UDP-N-acetylmuramoyl-tripeptide--D-alanyl-D-alanine ligase [Zoogloeaceae bacterium]|nr:UDP-N-acetylmuramoyl-tripeptide--D-alanyl-D-alanine ligase [Zoogloeaceae bacterium]